MVDLRRSILHGSPKGLPDDPVGAYILLQDRKTSGTAGGNFTAGDWRTRDLNTIAVDETGQVMLSSNQFTLPPGTYRINASAPAHRVDRHKTRLRDVDNAQTVLFGTSALSANLHSNVTHSFVRGQFAIEAPTTFELQHRGDTTFATGLGLDTSFGETEVFAEVELLKIA